MNKSEKNLCITKIKYIIYIWAQGRRIKFDHRIHCIYVLTALITAIITQDHQVKTS